MLQQFWEGGHCRPEYSCWQKQQPTSLVQIAYLLGLPDQMARATFSADACEVRASNKAAEAITAAVRHSHHSWITYQLLLWRCILRQSLPAI